GPRLLNLVLDLATIWSSFKIIPMTWKYGTTQLIKSQLIGTRFFNPIIRLSNGPLLRSFQMS
ncbi:MAG: hypothetical protein N2D54_02130, partial [Chloroflexota bacterium]